VRCSPSATEYLRQSGEIECLRHILGHITYMMVMRYVHLEMCDLARDVDLRSPFGSELPGPAPYETPHLTPHLTPPGWLKAGHPIAFGEGSDSDLESCHIPQPGDLRLQPLARIHDPQDWSSRQLGLMHTIARVPRIS